MPKTSIILSSLLLAGSALAAPFTPSDATLRKLGNDRVRAAVSDLRTSNRYGDAKYYYGKRADGELTLSDGSKVRMAKAVAQYTNEVTYHVLGKAAPGARGDKASFRTLNAKERHEVAGIIGKLGDPSVPIKFEGSPSTEREKMRAIRDARSDAARETLSAKTTMLGAAKASIRASLSEPAAPNPMPVHVETASERTARRQSVIAEERKGTIGWLERLQYKPKVQGALEDGSRLVVSTRGTSGVYVMGKATGLRSRVGVLTAKERAEVRRNLPADTHIMFKQVGEGRTKDALLAAKASDSVDDANRSQLNHMSQELR